MNYPLFSKNLRYEMRRQGITAKYIAIKLSIGEKRIHKWKEGVSFPSNTQLLVDLCDLLEIPSIDDFLKSDMSLQQAA